MLPVVSLNTTYSLAKGTQPGSDPEVHCASHPQEIQGTQEHVELFLEYAASRIKTLGNCRSDCLNSSAVYQEVKRVVEKLVD